MEKTKNRVPRAYMIDMVIRLQGMEVVFYFTLEINYPFHWFYLVLTI